MFGAPAAGKGTMAKKVSTEYGWPHISTGDIFRSAYEQGTPMGVEAYDKYWGQGHLVPDELTNGLAFERIRQEDCLNGFVLDGYPRTIGQGFALDEFIAKEKREIDIVIHLTCQRNLLLKRATGRRQCRDCGTIYGGGIVPKDAGYCDNCSGELYQRKDDTRKIVGERLKVYREQTAPLLRFYEMLNLVAKTDASLPMEKVFTSIQKIIESEC